MLEHESVAFTWFLLIRYSVKEAFYFGNTLLNLFQLKSLYNFCLQKFGHNKANFKFKDIFIYNKCQI